MTGRSYSICERINKNFEQTRGDGVLFEFGPSREQDLLWRDRIVRWQPQVRYESPSQFNREYMRFFGRPPIRDIKALRDGKVAAITSA